MKRRLRASLLAMFVLLGISIPAQASALFPPTAIYENQFVDVAENEWFYQNVATLYSLGLTNGKGDTAHFDPRGEMTVAEAVTMTARLRSIYDFGSSEVGANFFRLDEQAWYMPYYNYLRYLDIIGTEFDEQPHAPVTRAQVAHLLASVLPAELYEPINDDAVTVGYATGQYIRDVNDYTPYQQDILTLYRWGVVNGTDYTGSFAPNATILRCEAAAMFTRLVDSDLRITLPWEIRENETIYSLGDLVQSGGAFFPAPKPEDTSAIDADIRYMLARNERTIELDYGTPQSQQQVRAIMNAFLSVMRTYPEQDYNKISISANSTNGKITIRFSSTLYTEDMIEFYRENSLSKAQAVREQLYATGKISSTMSEYEKAKVYFDWLCNNCAYDFDCSDTGIGHSAYGVFQNKLAVCDGYTAAYNLLLKLEGIECTATDRKDVDHMWTIAVLDSTRYHIDVTWGDQTGTVAEQYFAMTEEESLSRFN